MLGWVIVANNVTYEQVLCANLSVIYMCFESEAEYGTSLS